MAQWLRSVRALRQGAMYVLNVVVDAKHRRRGVGRALVRAAARMAAQQWGSAAMCAHVDAQNDVRMNPP